jgi:hypothetical protein
MRDFSIRMVGADRELYYQTPQGSYVASYDIFMNMEVAGSQELFRSDANSARLGLIPQAPNPRTNPDGLPVGITKNVVTEGRWKGETVGPNCALCHTGQLNYKGKRIRIDGGHTNLFDLQAYIQALDDALQATLTDTAKFDRMAARIGAANPDAKSELRKRLRAKRADALLRHRRRSLPIAFRARPRQIASRSSTIDWRPSNPTFPEHLGGCGARQDSLCLECRAGNLDAMGRWIQDPLVRNYGETLGVYLPMDLQSKTPEEASSIRPPRSSISRRSRTMWRLAPPKWPEEILGKIDRAKAAQGKALFTTHCAELPQRLPYTWTAPNKFAAAASSK